MSFIRKKQDIFGLTTVLQNQDKPPLRSNNSSGRMLNRNLTPENVSSVKQELRQDNSCFQYGFPSLLELNEIRTCNQSFDSSSQKEIIEIKRGFSNLGISHTLTNHQEIRCEKFIPKQDVTERLQENDQSYSLFQYDHLFNNTINKEKSVSQNLPCCSSFDLSKISSEIQRQKDLIIVKRDDDTSYVLPSKIETDRKTIQLGNSSKDADNNLILNKLEDRKLDVSDKINHLDSDNNLVMTKPDDVNESSSVTKLIDLFVSLNDEPVDGELNEPDNVIIPKEETVHSGNPCMNNDNKIMNEFLMNDSKSKLRSSTLTVERVQSILEFYHSTTNCTLENESRENNNYSSDDEKESLSDIDFFDISNVKLLKCPQCDKEFSDRHSRERHIRTDHKITCGLCNKVLFHLRQLQHHEEKVHGNYIMNRPKRRGSIQTKRRRNPRTYFCCGQTFKTGREFGIHKSTHKFMRNRTRIH